MPVDVSLPPVVGDPSGMRSLAAALRTDAESAAAIGALEGSTVDGLEFSGPAATRLDGAARSTATTVGRLAERLLAVAALLERSASEVEAEQAARERKLEQLRRELSSHGWR